MTLFLMASGVTLVIMMGGIDLSVQAVASMTSCILAVYLPHLGFFAIPFAVLGGIVAGFAGGYVSTRLRIPSFIATLAVSGVVLSAGYWFSETRSVNIPGELSQQYLSWAVGDFLGVPNEIWVGAFFLILLSAVLGLTPFGRIVRGIGAQERAVIASGIDVDRVKIAAYTLSGTMAGIAGVVMAARLGSGSPTLANEFLLPAIASHRGGRHGHHRRCRLRVAHLRGCAHRAGRQDRHDLHGRFRLRPADRLRRHPGGRRRRHHGPHQGAGHQIGVHT